MNFSNFLSISIDIFNDGFGGSMQLNWIGKIINNLILSFGSIGLGIIMFTLILKLITLPLDIWSRVSMKKNSLKLESIRPKLEKLQRQYANNKQLYNQKMQALYKKEGYSMFSTCLPSIVSIVIFIVVMTQFDNFAKQAEWKLYNSVSAAYTQEIKDFDDGTDNSIVKIVDNKAYLNENYIYDNEDYFTDIKKFMIKTASTENSYDATFSIDTTKMDDLAAYLKTINAQGFNEIKVSDTEKDGYHVIKENGNYVFNKDEFVSGATDEQINQRACEDIMNYVFENYSETAVLEDARNAARDAYLENAPRFLWIKNLWMPDLPFKHPMYNSIADANFIKESGITVDEAQYSEITMNLGVEKTRANGYFILIIFSVGFMFLSQLISMKSQKSQMELQSVDGQAAQTSKMMMWMMPIIFGVFSFLYSGAFSLYMTVSTIFSMLSTLLINFLVERKFKKQYGLVDGVVEEKEDKKKSAEIEEVKPQIGKTKYVVSKQVVTENGKTTEIITKQLVDEAGNYIEGTKKVTTKEIIKKQ